MIIFFHLVYEKKYKNNCFLQIPPCITSPAESTDSLKFISTTPNFPSRADDWPLISRIAIASVTSQGTMGGLIIAGFVCIILSKIGLFIHKK